MTDQALRALEEARAAILVLRRAKGLDCGCGMCLALASISRDLDAVLGIGPPLTDAVVDAFLANEPPPDPEKTARIRQHLEDRLLDRSHYLGDGVSVEATPHGFVLSALNPDDGREQRIVIEPEVYEQLAWWVRKSIIDGTLPFTIQFKDREQ